MKYLKYLVVIGDVVFIFWILYNAIDSGFQNAASLQNIALFGLIVLLLLNITLLFRGISLNK